MSDNAILSDIKLIHSRAMAQHPPISQKIPAPARLTGDGGEEDVAPSTAPPRPAPASRRAPSPLPSADWPRRLGTMPNRRTARILPGPMPPISAILQDGAASAACPLDCRDLEAATPADPGGSASPGRVGVVACDQRSVETISIISGSTSSLRSRIAASSSAVGGTHPLVGFAELPRPRCPTQSRQRQMPLRSAVENFGRLEEQRPAIASNAAAAYSFRLPAEFSLRPMADRQPPSIMLVALASRRSWPRGAQLRGDEHVPSECGR